MATQDRTPIIPILENHRWCAVLRLMIRVTVMAAALSPVDVLLANDKDRAFFDPASLDPNIPSPESVVGFPVGERAVRYDELVSYLRALSEASARVRMTPTATSHEGRTLYYLTITSVPNYARLDAIRDANAKLADPRNSNDREIRSIIERLPAVAWLAYAIHGDELSSTDAAMYVAYRLAAGNDEDTERLRQELVVNIDPLMNPDGRERYLSQLQVLNGKVPSFDHQSMQHGGLWSAGRGNHYLFDLNRDWLMQVQPETQGRVAAILSWNPHLVVDSHEMGSLDTYLFDPPREPINPHLSKSVMQWRRRFSADQARAFDRHGWSYYTREWYEEWYPGYTNSWASLLGAVGILYEQAAVNGAAVRQASGDVLTYREAVHHQFVSSYANLESLRVHRKEVLRHFVEDRRQAVAADESESAVFLLSPSPDRSRFRRLATLLQRHGLSVSLAENSFDARSVVDVWGGRRDSLRFAAGALIVNTAQPHGRLLRSMLEFDPHLSDEFLLDERTELEQRRGSRLYDVTAWNLCMAYGLEGFWAKSVEGLQAKRYDPSSGRSASFPDSVPAYGYLIDGADSNVPRLLGQLLERGYKPRVGQESVALGGLNLAAGSILLRRHENAADVGEVLKELATDLWLDVHGVDTALSESGPDLGGQRFSLLQPPRIAIATQWPITTTSFGHLWHLLDARLGVRCSPINVQRLGQIDLRQYNVLVLPHTRQGEALGRVIDKNGAEKIKSWVESGGTLVAIGGAAAWVADEQRGLSKVRLRRDVLEGLETYAEAVGRERSARDVTVDSSAIWGSRREQTVTDDESGDEAVSEGKKVGKPELEFLQRQDEWERIFSPTGVIVAAVTDPEHWLCFGLGDKLPLLVAGGYAFMSGHPVATPVRLLDESHLRLSGLLWPEARKRLADTAYATVERMGHGQVILFAFDPNFRGYFEASARLFSNAVMLGPGFGASTPIPW